MRKSVSRSLRREPLNNSSGDLLQCLCPPCYTPVFLPGEPQGKDWQSPGPRRTEQGREGHRPQEKGAAGIREEGEARTAGGDSHSAVCELKTQALEKRGLLVSFSIRLRARLLASFGVKGTLCWGLCPRSWAMLLGQGWAGAGLEEFCSPAGGKGHLRSLSARCPRTGVTPQPGGARGPGSKTKSVSTTQQVTQISRMGLRVNSS